MCQSACKHKVINPSNHNYIKSSYIYIIYDWLKPVGVQNDTSYVFLIIKASTDNQICHTVLLSDTYPRKLLLKFDIIWQNRPLSINLVS